MLVPCFFRGWSLVILGRCLVLVGVVFLALDAGVAVVVFVAFVLACCLLLVVS